MTHENLFCIMVAAGESSRMGEWKLMLPYRGSTIFSAALSSARRACSGLIVVSGYRSAELRQYIESLGYGDVLLTENKEYRKGMFSSIQCGIRLLRTLVEEDGRDGSALTEPPRFFISLADMPRIDEQEYRSLASIATDADVVRPVRHGVPAHPVLCRYPVAGTILAEPAESAMKHVLAQHRVLEVPAADDTLLFDVDTPESYRRLLEGDAEGKEE